MVGVKIAKADDRPWQERWLFVLHHLGALRSAYAGEVDLGNIEVEARAISFFVECDHMRDWLKGDVGNLPGVCQRDITGHCNSSIPLQWCNAICNSHKHFKRTTGMTASVRQVTMDSEGRYTVAVELDWATSGSRPYDALTLAEECVASWRKFLAAHFIPEP